jgi:hypothetical protein
MGENARHQDSEMAASVDVGDCEIEIKEGRGEGNRKGVVFLKDLLEGELLRMPGGEDAAPGTSRRRTGESVGGGRKDLAFRGSQCACLVS